MKYLLRSGFLLVEMFCFIIINLKAQSVQSKYEGINDLRKMLDSFVELDPDAEPKPDSERVQAWKEREKERVRLVKAEAEREKARLGYAKFTSDDLKNIR